MFEFTQEKIDEQFIKAQKMFRAHQEELYKDIPQSSKSYNTLPELLQKNVFLGAITFGHNLIA